MLKPKNLRNNKGYLLLESIASITVIAIGLAVILRSFTSSLRASKISQEYFTATSLLNDNICDLEGKAKINGGIDEREQKEIEIPDTKYKLKVKVKKIEDPYFLADVKAEISWDSGSRHEKIGAGTFLRYKQQ